jgi:hypothetical protein
MTAGANPVLQWTEPLLVATQLQIPVTASQKSFRDPTRKAVVIFRAKHTFQHAPAFDNVKVLIENGNGDSSWYFGRCIAFMSDANDDHFIVLRWFTRLVDIHGSAANSRAPSFTLAPENETKSYSVLPVSCILNGAFMIPGDGRFWALLSPQEQQIYSQMQN